MLTRRIKGHTARSVIRFFLVAGPMLLAVLVILSALTGPVISSIYSNVINAL